MCTCIPKVYLGSIPIYQEENRPGGDKPEEEKQMLCQWRRKAPGVWTQCSVLHLATSDLRLAGKSPAICKIRSPTSKMEIEILLLSTSRGLILLCLPHWSWELLPWAPSPTPITQLNQWPGSTELPTRVPNVKMSKGVCIPCVPLSCGVLLVPTAQTSPLTALCTFTASTALQPLTSDLAHKGPEEKGIPSDGSGNPMFSF